jgi:hypothetical protein
MRGDKSANKAMKEGTRESTNEVTSSGSVNSLGGLATLLGTVNFLQSEATKNNSFSIVSLYTYCCIIAGFLTSC